MTQPAKRYIWGEPDKSEAGAVEFRLTYGGPLRADTRSARDIANHKQDLRKCFHRQLARLWVERPHLKASFVGGEEEFGIGFGGLDNRMEELAARFQRNGYRYVPLVTKDLEVSCAVDILYLRHGPVGHIIQRQDIDNRIKTLFDALKMPGDLQDLGNHISPSDGEDPFFCLVEDDSLITALSVQTDLLLEPPSEPTTSNDARLLITVTIRPMRFLWRNVAFG